MFLMLWPMPQAAFWRLSVDGVGDDGERQDGSENFLMSTLILDQQQHLFYQKYTGKTDHPWLIFLHEGLGCTALWRDFPERLCQRTGCPGLVYDLSLIHISEPTRRTPISYAVFCWKKKKSPGL